MNKIKIFCAAHYQGDSPSVKPGDAGIDLRYVGKEPLTFGAVDGQQMIPTGLHVEIPSGMCGLIWGRSGMAKKHGLNIHAGVIDETYRGELVCIASVVGNNIITLNLGDRFAQMVVVPYLNVIEMVGKLEDLSSTERGEKGFGSSGQA